MEMLMDRQTDKKRTNGRNYTNFESNLAMMVIYVPVKFEFDWTKRFRVKSPKMEMLTDRQTKNGQTNEQNYTNFESKLAMMVIYLSVKLEFDWTKRFRVKSGNENVDRQMDIRHINLIGRLVTCNPP